VVAVLLGVRFYAPRVRLVLEAVCERAVIQPLDRFKDIGHPLVDMTHERLLDAVDPDEPVYDGGGRLPGCVVGPTDEEFEVETLDPDGVDRKEIPDGEFGEGCLMWRWSSARRRANSTTGCRRRARTVTPRAGRWRKSRKTERSVHAQRSVDATTPTECHETGAWAAPHGSRFHPGARA